MTDFSLYFHVPFCSRKCDYCHFYVVPNQERHQDTYMEGLAIEWRKRLPLITGKRLTTVYFGGGTPSLLGPEKIGKIISWIAEKFPLEGIEITLEANPENITREQMEAYRNVGINRVSIGVQSFDDRLLLRLGRTHDAQTAINAVNNTYQAGITNISIDLMYELPSQSITSWHRTLSQAALLPITHLSLYNLTIEPQTVFYKYRKDITAQLPDEDVSLKMYEMAIDLLEESGLWQYEISAFARDGQISQHNIGYWTARPFIGLGPSAFSYWEGGRFQNVGNLNKYSSALKEDTFPVDFVEQLQEEAQKCELLAIYLRLRSGICLEKFQEEYGAVNETTLGNIKKLTELGLLEKNDSQLALSKKGVLFYDTVAAEIIEAT
ncbi:MAG: radical SAM family heme chaperone HemW [Chlamydiales bacterium]|nr:radical SAM family heme chaperone HemW [Chlamydiales bacterium]